MGQGIYIATQSEIAGLDTVVDGQAMFDANEKTLNKICKELHIPTILDYLSRDPARLRATFDELEIEMPDIPETEEKWFPPGEGVRFTEVLLKHFHENPRSMKNLAGLVKNLQDYQLVFRALVEHGVKWHFDDGY